MRSTSELRSHTGYLLLLALIGLFPAGAWAHGGPIMIEFYGGFTANAAKCLRHLTIEGRRCARQRYILQRRCKDQEVRGEICDRVTLDAKLDAVMGNALSTVDRECSGGQLTELGFTTFGDTRSDMRQYCLRAEDVISQTYYPAEEVPGDETRRMCALLAAELNQKLFLRTLALRGHALDRIAVRFMTRTQKLKLLNNVGKQLTRMREKVVAKLQTQCPDFAAIYNRDLETYTTSVEQSGNCALSFLFAQNVVLCPQ